MIYVIEYWPKGYSDYDGLKKIEADLPEDVPHRELMELAQKELRKQNAGSWARAWCAKPKHPKPVASVPWVECKYLTYGDNS